MRVSKRFTILDHEHFKADLEYDHEYAILHLPFVDKMTKDLLEYMVVNIEPLADFLKGLGYEDLYAGAPTDYKAVHRLLKKIGFKHIGMKDNIEVFIFEGEV